MRLSRQNHYLQGRYRSGEPLKLKEYHTLTLLAIALPVFTCVRYFSSSLVSFLILETRPSSLATKMFLMIKAVDDLRTLNKTLYISPPNNILSMNEMVTLWEKKIGKSLEKTHISEEQIHFFSFAELKDMFFLRTLQFPSMFSSL